jgi:UDP-N-acetylmuramoyl-L-alanyl-D-glutamate--2,6-diaminopimelate ligase
MTQSLWTLFDGIRCQGLMPAHRSLIIREIANDSRRVQPDTLFVALPGQETHGLRYVPDAIRRGAVAVLAPLGSADQVGDVKDRVAWIEVEDPRALLAELSARVYDYPARELSLAGITGTNGKTTTVYMLAHILAHAGHSVAFWSTNSVEGVRHPYRPSMTTPDPPVLHQYLREVRQRGAHHVILEVSSHALTLGRVEGLVFEAAAITNISPDHLDFHGSFEAYQKAKARLIAKVPATGVAFLNQEDPAVRVLAERASCPVRFFGLTSGADVYARQVTLLENGSSWEWVNRGKCEGTVVLHVPGLHNVMNALAALGMATHFQVDPKTAIEALKTFQPAARRLEMRHVGSYTVISDVAMNQASYDAVMTTIGDWHRPLVVVHAIRGNRGTQVNADIADVLAEWNERLQFAPVIATLSTSYLQQLSIDYQVRPQECEAFLSRARDRGLAVELYSELSDALDAAIRRLEPRGVLLLLGTFGMDAALPVAEQKLRDRGH